MPENRCPYCQAINRQTARFCAECGRPLVAPPPSAETSPSHPAEETPSSEGEVLGGRYRLVDVLHRSASLATYKGWDIHLSRPCVIKEISLTTPEEQHSFQAYTSRLASLDHPNLPRFTDHFAIAGRGLFLVMDFIEGESLEERRHRQGIFEPAEVLPWLLQVCDALGYLHSQKPPLFHADLKPANVRLTSEGKAVLVDIGLAFLLPPAGPPRGEEEATHDYIPPEQVTLRDYGVPSEVYALAATLYTLLTGQEPLAGWLRLAGERLAAPHEVNPRLPLAVSKVLARALALQPSERYVNVGEFCRAFQEALASLESAEAPLPAAPSPPHREKAPTATTAVPSTLPSRTILWVGIALGGVGLLFILCLAIAGALFFMDGKRQTPTPLALISETALPPQAGQATPTATPEPTVHPAFRSKDPTTFTYVTIADPDTLDPALVYETGGLMIVQNIYDTLIFYRREDPSTFVPQLALEVPSQENGGISPDGRSYTFKIRPGVRFHNGQWLTPDDVAYSFQRSILQGGSHSPMWLLTEPIFGIGVYDVAALIDPAFVDNPQRLAQADPAQLEAVCRRLQEAIRADNDEGTVTFHLAQPWAPFLATLANGWGGIQSKQWVIANGGWDGDCRTWQKYYGRTIAELNKTPLGASAMGSGPYRLERWDFGRQIVLKANEEYWRSEPPWEGGPNGAPKLKTVVILIEGDFEKRLALLENGQADAIYDRDTQYWPALDELTGQICRLSDADCSPSQNPQAPLEMLRGFPAAGRMFDVFLNWQINTQGGNPLLGSGRLDGKGVPPDFFANVHVRRAFQFCFNYDRYLKEVMGGEGIRAITVMLPGMVGYEANAPYYTHNPAQCEAELRQAIFGGRSVWEVGFTIKLPYPEGSQARRTIAEILRDEFSALNNRFNLQPQPVSENDYWSLHNDNRLPLFHSGWIEDIHDPHNWVVPYTVGIYGRRANISPEVSAQFQALINRAVQENDPARRAQIYAEFNQLFYEVAPAILLYQSIERHYQQRWVRHYYHNPVYPGLYFYPLSKD